MLSLMPPHGVSPHVLSHILHPTDGLDLHSNNKSNGTLLAFSQKNIITLGKLNFYCIDKMNVLIKNRLAAFREWLQNKRVDAFIVPSNDPHLSEYVAPHWKSREWISGFTGSAGTVVITLEEAGLWTDSRYFLQAAQQLEGTGIALYKEMLPETPSIAAFLGANLKPQSVVAVDGAMFSAQQLTQLKEDLEEGYGLQVTCLEDPFQALWTDRPAIPPHPAFIHDIQYAGQTATEKLDTIRSILNNQQAEALLIPMLDEIAWTLNLRGSDVHCNPVVISYLIVGKQDAHLFIQPEKISTEVAEYLREIPVTLHNYSDIFSFLEHIPAQSILLDPAKTNYAAYSALPPTCRKILAASPVALLKAIRHPQEIVGIHQAMLKDGIALVKFLKWLEEAVPSRQETEMSADRKLHDFRAEQPLYMGESFDTIAGYREHGAIVHYEATPETDAVLQPRGFLLLDSGAQYLDGTTDITRTIALGELTEEEKTDYTLILKGHIDLAMAVFPEGTRGTQLDVLARLPIWQRKMNYLHGTGHGVGHFLNVHEGPQSIRMNENPVTLHAGMVTSNEPGVYKADSHGIRIENLILTVPAGEGMFGRYLRFETLTLCPICTQGILKELLTAEEIHWLNQYHLQVYQLLTPYLQEEEKNWLQKACQAI